MVQLSTSYTDHECHNAQRHRQTVRQTHNDANSCMIGYECYICVVQTKAYVMCEKLPLSRWPSELQRDAIVMLPAFQHRQPPALQAGRHPT